MYKWGQETLSDGSLYSLLQGKTIRKVKEMGSELHDRSEKRPGKKPPRDWWVEPELMIGKEEKTGRNIKRWGNENRHLCN